MSISGTNENKNTVNGTNESKTGTTDTFGMHPESFGENSTPFGTPGIGGSRESKNTITATNETKN